MKILIVGNKLDGMGNLRNDMRIAKALKSLGHEIWQVNPQDGPVHFFLPDVNKYDLILGFGQLLYQKNLRLIPQIAKAKNSDTIFAVWSFDSCSEIDEPSRTLNQKIKSILPHIDWLVTTDHNYPWEKYAKNYLHLFQGIDPDEFNYQPSNNHNRRFDLIYAGGLWDRYKERNQTIKELAKNFLMLICCFQKQRFDGFKNITFRDRVYEKDFFDTHQEAKMAYIPRPPSKVKADYWSNRIYLAGATGTPCVAEYVEGMEKEFNQNEVIFTDGNEDTIKRVFYFLDKPKERQEIGLNARRRILRQYTYENRAKTLMKAIFG